MSDPAADARRFTELYNATRRDLLAYLVRRTGDPEQAADLLSETYLIAWRRLEHVPHGNGERLWLFGVARNLLLKTAHHQRLHETLITNIANELERIAQVDGAAPDGPRVDALRDGIARLPANEREALLLTAWEGFAPREIAEITRASANVTRVRLARARRKLRRHLADERRTSERLEGAASRSDLSRS